MYFSLCLEPVTSCASYHVIRFTRLSPLFLHTASDQKLEVGKSWDYFSDVYSHTRNTMHMYSD